MQRYYTFLSWGTNALENIEAALKFWEEKYQSIFEILTTSPAEYKDGVIWDTVKGVFNIIEAIGVSLLIIFFFYGIIKMGLDYRDALRSPKTIIFQFVRFVIADFIVANSMEILLYILSFCQGIMAKIHINTALSLSVPDDLRVALENADWSSGMGAYVASLVGWLMIFILSVIIMIVVYGRFFKIFLLAAISPIPLAGFSSEPTAALGRNFLKSYIGECFRGVIILVACLIFSAFTISPVTLDSASPGVMMWMYVMNVSMQMLILVIMVKGSDSIVKEILHL